MKNIRYLAAIYFFIIAYIFAQSSTVQIETYKSFNKNSDGPIAGSSSHTILADSVIELKWDSSRPVGYLLELSENDTVCVAFDSIPGGRLDSIRIALATAGSVVGGVWEYLNQGKSPLGRPLAVPVTANITTTASVPYSFPFNNWSTVDLRSFNIHTDVSFAVAFAVGKDSTVPGFIVEKYPSKTYYHSLTYFTPSNGQTGWYYLIADADSVYIYLIRAYVSRSFATEVNENQKTELKYSLSQNYPNPFNPETLIKYSIAEESFVKIKIYDILGNTITELVNSIKGAGEHLVKFNASSGNLSSGIYFYSLETNSVKGNKNYSNVRKLIYLK